MKLLLQSFLKTLQETHQELSPDIASPGKVSIFIDSIIVLLLLYVMVLGYKHGAIMQLGGGFFCLNIARGVYYADENVRKVTTCLFGEFKQLADLAAVLILILGSFSIYKLCTFLLRSAIQGNSFFFLDKPLGICLAIAQLTLFLGGIFFILDILNIGNKYTNGSIFKKHMWGTTMQFITFTWKVIYPLLPKELNLKK